MKRIIVALGLTIATAAHGQTPVRDPEPATPMRSTSYGIQILAVDLASAALGMAAHHFDSDPALALAMTTWSAGAAAVHFAHGHAVTGLDSLALHVSLPILGALIDLAALPADCWIDTGEPHCDVPPAGMIGGMILATTIDATTFAWERHPAAPRPGLTRPRAAAA
ncbi:MAG TPA: hypothetical protein VL172_16340, partial [Kofleriaceae bacterium]|nr:hypothetical protein [Kofleriaceae bacterium]